MSRIELQGEEFRRLTPYGYCEVSKLELINELTMLYNDRKRLRDAVKLAHGTLSTINGVHVTDRPDLCKMPEEVTWVQDFSKEAEQMKDALHSV